MMKLESSMIRNECNSRDGLRRDASMVVVVVMSHPGLSTCFSWCLAGFWAGRLSAAIPDLTYKFHPHSYHNMLFHANQGYDNNPAMTITVGPCP